MNADRGIFKKPLPYYRWNVRDHRAHWLCKSLSCFAEGMLRKLLDEQWEEGCIPADVGRLARLLGEPIGVVTEAWQTLQDLFHDVPGTDGFYVANDRLELERTEADALRALKSIAGKKGGRPKAEKSRGPQGDLLLEGDSANSLRGVEMGKHTKADESSGKHTAQESSSRSRAEQSRRELGADVCMCGGRDGFHRPDCVLVRFERPAASPYLDAVAGRHA